MFQSLLQELVDRGPILDDLATMSSGIQNSENLPVLPNVKSVYEHLLTEMQVCVSLKESNIKITLSCS